MLKPKPTLTEDRLYSNEVEPPHGAGLADQITQLQQMLLAQQAQISELKTKLAQQAAIPSQKSVSVSANPLTPSRASLHRRKWLKQLSLGMLGSAAAAVALGSNSSTAKAASNDFVLLGNSNVASNTTYVSQVGGAVPSDGAILWGDWNPTAKSNAPGTGVKAGIAGTSSEGVGGYFQGSTAPILLVPATTTGVPTGTHKAGELYVDSNGDMYLCKTGSTPGPVSWVKFTSLPVL